MTDKELKQIQKQKHFDIGRFLTEAEVRELIELRADKFYTLCDILSYVSINALQYSVDFIKEIQTQYAKEYAHQNHVSKIVGMRTAKNIIQADLIALMRKELTNSTRLDIVDLMKKLVKERYIDFFK